jgi:signal transduction histidine kinase
LANQKEIILNPVMFPADSPFIKHMRLDGLPLTQYDIDTHPNFDKLIEQERTLINRWQRMAYIPLRVGQHLTGLLAVGEKGFDEPYSRQDFDTLHNIAAQVSPFLAQARQVNNLHQLNKFVFRQNQILIREKRYLWELVALNNKFLDFVSPELREPLAVIEQELRALQEPSFEQKFKLEHERALEQKSMVGGRTAVAPEENHRLETLANDTARIKGLISGLINAVARVEKQNQFSYELVHVDEAIRQAVRNLSAMAEARRVHVDMALVGNLRPVIADQEKMVEAIQHLLHNAIKFNKIGGQVRIEYSGDGQDMVIDVIDNGVGIPVERLDTIWDGMSRADSKTTGNAKQLGMGLILTQFIVRAHGGRIVVQSKHGAGSTFSIYLPAALEED